MLHTILRFLAHNLTDQHSASSHGPRPSQEPLPPEWQPIAFRNKLEASVGALCIECAQAIQKRIFGWRFVTRWTSLGVGIVLAYYGLYVASWTAVTLAEPVVGSDIARFIGILGFILYAGLFGTLPAWIYSRFRKTSLSGGHTHDPWLYALGVGVVLQLVTTIGLVWLFAPARTRDLGESLIALTIALYGVSLILSGISGALYQRVSPAFVVLCLGERFDTHALGITHDPERPNRLVDWMASRIGSRFQSAPHPAWLAVKQLAESQSALRSNSLQPLLGIAASLALLGVISNQLPPLLGRISDFVAWSGSPITAGLANSTSNTSGLEVYLTLFVLGVVAIVTRLFIGAYVDLRTLVVIQQVAEQQAHRELSQGRQG